MLNSKQLALPPFGSLVKISGKRVATWIERSGLAERLDLEFAQIDDDVFEFRSTSVNELLDQISSARIRFPATSVRFEVDAS